MTVRAPLKVLHFLSNPNIGGTETFVLSISPLLSSLGHEVEVANLWVKAAMEVPASSLGICYKELQGGKRLPTLCGFAGFRRHLLRERFDIVCAYGLRASMIARFVGHTLSPRPVLVTGLRSIDDWRQWWHVWPDRLTQDLVDCFVGNSESVCEMRRRRERTRADRLVCIPNGIDVQRFSQDSERWPDRDELSLPEEVLCLTVASFRAPKGHHFLLRVIAELGEAARGVHFAFVGKGPEEPRLKDEAERLGIADRVVFCGLQMDVRPYLANADIFVLPSREEGMPRALMEAMSMGIPALATRVGGTPEVLRDGKEGFLVPYGDVREAAERLKLLLHDAALRTRFGRLARTRIMEHFDIRDIAREYGRLFNRLCSERRAWRCSGRSVPD